MADVIEEELEVFVIMLEIAGRKYVVLRGLRHRDAWKRGDFMHFLAPMIIISDDLSPLLSDLVHQRVINVHELSIQRVVQAEKLRVWHLSIPEFFPYTHIERHFVAIAIAQIGHTIAEATR